MKRPMATVGFSMLLVSLLVTNISFKSSVALLIGATVAFCLFISFKKLRQYKFVIFSLFAVVIYIVSFVITQNVYIKAESKYKEQTQISGIVCQTPKETDYAFTYIIKPDNENYKIRYVSQDNKMFREGDIVSGVVKTSENEFVDDFFENSLSSKVYFTFFEDEDVSLDKTGETNKFYKNIGAVKSWFSDIVDTYLPGESGAIAKAMTIGDKSEIKDTTIDNFNYSGTAHLLVISGLHLTLWSIGLMSFIEKFPKLRKYTALIGMLCLLMYSALTGFSISVVRAGTMIGAVLLGKALHRDADSINSIGVALTFILAINPYATFSSALWFTTLSTLGILVISQKVMLQIKESEKYKKIMHNKVTYLIIGTFVVSASTTVFTLPIFIAKFNILPVMSFVSNILMIDLALVLMVFAIIGVVLHSTGMFFMADVLFTIVGSISNLLKIFAEKIGRWDYSTISISHRYFAYFLIFALVVIAISFLVKKYRNILLKGSAILLVIIFVLLTLYCNAYDYNTPSIDVVFTDSTPILVVNYKDESVVVNPPSTKYEDVIMRILNTHNEKIVDNILITENTNYTPSYLIDFYNRFNVINTFFCYEAPRVFEDLSQSNVKKLVIGKDVKINAEKYEEMLEITYGNKSLVMLDGETAENLFEKIKYYDIIILYGKNTHTIKENIENVNSKTTVIVSEDMLEFSIHFD
ncbi:MAG: ComEC/Rec2 family competence protein [Clostridia bacterium]|nr:ComEC/Rec2 family competence protein [Clostridia bacterium]